MSGAPALREWLTRSPAAHAFARTAYLAGRGVARRTGRAATLAAAKAGRWRVECPVCGWRFRAFAPHGLRRRSNARCPRCGSLERQRLLYLYLRDHTGFFRDRLRVLHLSPERELRRFRELENLELVTADLNYPTVDINLDLTRMPVRDGAFDVILCSHMLEHVPDDRAAMRELRRVLRPGGQALMMVPYHPALAHTVEDPSVTDPAERERRFGQKDHVRLYGLDFRDRLAEAGFEVREEWITRSLDRHRYGLLEEPIHVCTK